MRARIVESVRASMMETARDEVHQWLRGEVDALSTIAQIAARYDLHRNTAKMILEGIPEHKVRTNILRRQTRTNHQRTSCVPIKPLPGLELARIVAESQHKRIVIKKYDVSVFKKPAFAQLVGIYQEAQHTAAPCISLCCKDKDEARDLATLIEQVFGDAASDRPAPSAYLPLRRRVSFHSDQVMHVIHALTGMNTHPPYAILQNNPTTITYLRGFFRGASVDTKRPRLHLRGRNRLPIIQAVGAMLAPYGIHARPTHYGVAVYQIESLKRIEQMELLPGKEHERLVTLLEKGDHYFNDPYERRIRDARVQKSVLVQTS